MFVEEGVHLLFQLRGQAVAAGEDAPEEAEIRVFQVLRPEQGLEQGGHTGNQVGLLLHQGMRIGLHIELGNEHAGAPGNQRGMDADAQAEAVEHGHDGEHLHIGDFLHGEAGGGDGLKGQGVEVQVGEHDALGGAGGAAGVENGAAVLTGSLLGLQGHILSGLYHVLPQGIPGFGQLFDGPGPLGHGIQHAQGQGQLLGHSGNENFRGMFQLGQDSGHLVVELVQSQDGFAFGEIQIEGDLLGGGQGVDHIGDGAQVIEGVEAVQSLGGVGHADGHLIPLPDAHFVKTLGSGMDPAQKFPIGGLFAHEYIGDVVGLAFGGSGHHLIHGLVGIIQGGRRIAVIFQPGSGCGDAHLVLFLSLPARMG